MRLASSSAAVATSLTALQSDVSAVCAAEAALRSDFLGGSAAAGHVHVSEGLEDLVDHHRVVLDLLGTAVQLLADQVAEFDAVMGEVDESLAAGC